MPYAIKRSGKGKFKVVNRDTGKTYSKKPQSAAKAKTQLAAIEINTHGK